jgi:hypothetical protein
MAAHYSYTYQGTAAWFGQAAGSLQAPLLRYWTDSVRLGPRHREEEAPKHLQDLPLARSEITLQQSIELRYAPAAIIMTARDSCASLVSCELPLQAMWCHRGPQKPLKRRKIRRNEAFLTNSYYHAMMELPEAESPGVELFFFFLLLRR